jgi:uncharacterized membrane protein YgcG
MTGPRPTGPRDLVPAELGTTDPADLAAALEAAHRLVGAIEEAPITSSGRFTDRVMAALAAEPSPAPTGFLAPLRRRGIVGGFGASVRQAWASIGAPGRPTFARATALAYVLAIAIAGTSLAGAATITVAGALGLIGPHESQPTQTLPAQTLPPESSEQPSAESEPPGPEESESPSVSPDASDDHGGGGGGPVPSDDHGGNSGPGSSAGSGSDDGSGGGGSGATASPTGGGGSDDSGGSSTPRPTQTPRPTETPKPTSTSGSSDGSGTSD